MLKYSWLVLGVLLVFGALVALLPEPPGVTAESGVRLQEVKLRLYPSQDADAEWRFSAPAIRYDPLGNETLIRDPREGGRYVRDGDQLKLDMTISTQELTIDAGDNLRTQQARLYIPADCTTVRLQGDADAPVVINQASGYSAPLGSISAPSYKAEMANFVSDFQLNATGDFTKPTEFYSSPDVTCLNGRIVSKDQKQQDQGGQE